VFIIILVVAVVVVVDPIQKSVANNQSHDPFQLGKLCTGRPTDSTVCVRTTVFWLMRASREAPNVVTRRARWSETFKLCLPPRRNSYILVYAFCRNARNHEINSRNRHTGRQYDARPPLPLTHVLEDRVCRVVSFSHATLFSKHLIGTNE
jgi:hypothetical protein